VLKASYIYDNIWATTIKEAITNWA
jgi:hypothetical protein